MRWNLDAGGVRAFRPEPFDLAQQQLVPFAQGVEFALLPVGHVAEFLHGPFQVCDLGLEEFEPG